MSDYPPPTFDITKPHSARVWNYWLGGKDYFEVDREYGDRYFEMYPEIVEIARVGRAFLRRAVTHLAGEAGIRQFLDIGTGLPTMENTHEIAQRIAPDARVVYVDNDPLVLLHARALLVGTSEGATAYIDADVHDPEKILAGAAEILDFTRPVGLMLIGIMGNVADVDEAYAIVRRLLDEVPSGSYLTLGDGVVLDEAVRALSEGPDGHGYYNRSVEEIVRFFDGLELLEPGVVSTSLWRPAPGSAPAALDAFCGVARKL
ncbi:MULTISPECIES: SAM-dependent methyltransferase [unclassified Frankia]|uniref:SAM-dependent methyltransferase n=1 Tax=unclassified Frankia TaxID=2632575 RepID=UPI001EF40C3D|nr:MULTISPECIES: SAM-dependent methyltransferase [unclassified Frankia]